MIKHSYWFICIKIIEDISMQEIDAQKSAWRFDGLWRGRSTKCLKDIPDLGTLPNYSHKKTKIEMLRNLDQDSILVLRVAIFSSWQYIKSTTWFCITDLWLETIRISSISHVCRATALCNHLRRKTKRVALYPFVRSLSNSVSFLHSASLLFLVLRERWWQSTRRENNDCYFPFFLLWGI